MNETPLISVGIPTYNRPEGLERTLQQITNQTYKNLEIIVSNNASEDHRVQEVINRYQSVDSRIISFLQKKNIGIGKNFKFVLKNASGEFFMWAADDDEWHPFFIEVCFNAIGKYGTAMTGFIRFNRFQNTKTHAMLPVMNGEDKFADIIAFYNTLSSSIFYGLHRKDSLIWLLNEDQIDDVFFIIKQILDFGIVTIPDKILYTAGIDDVVYKIKVPQQYQDRYFNHYKLIIKLINLIAEHPALNSIQKLELLRREVLFRLWYILCFEKEIRSASDYAIAAKINSFIHNFKIENIDLYTTAINEINIKNKEVIQDVNNLIKERKRLAEYWLNLPSDQLEIAYNSDMGNLHRKLMETNLRNEALTQEENAFLQQLIAELTKRSATDPASSINYLLAAMLYLPKDRLKIENARTSLPGWLIRDYERFFI